MTVLHGPNVSAAVDALANAAVAAGVTPAAPLCPECGKPWHAVHPNQLFCSTACRTAFNRRCASRGRRLLPYAATARATRDGTRGNPTERHVGKRASHAANLLMQRWRDEDAAAGRMAIPAFVDLRYRAGFEPF